MQIITSNQISEDFWKVQQVTKYRFCTEAHTYYIAKGELKVGKVKAK